MTSTDSFRGLIVAPLTPMNEDGSLRLEMINRLAEWFAKCGLVGVFICGTTGEGMSLTTDERMQVAHRWTAAAGSKLRVIVHVGHNSVRDACALAAHAKKIGAHAVSSLPPFYFRPGTVEDLVEFLKPIALAAGSLPFYYYHIPSLTGVGLQMPHLLDQAGERISNFAGMKFTSDDLVEFRRCLQVAGDRFEVLFGMDELLLPALALGARGAVGSTYNYSAPIFRPLLDAWHRGDLEKARTWADRAMALGETVECFGYVQGGKAILSLLGIECGPPRLPLRPLSRDRILDLRDRLEARGLLDILKSGPSPS